MSALDFMVDSLADVMQQRPCLGGSDVSIELLREHAGQVRHLKGMLKDVLAIAGAEVEPAEERDEPRVETDDSRFVGRFFSFLLHHLPDILLSLLDGLLDLSGLDASVGDERFERQLRRVATDGVERGERDLVGSVIDDDVDSGRALERLDVAAFLADYLSLHFLGRDLYGQRHHVAVNGRA